MQLSITPLSLSKLIKNINQVEVISEQLDLYKDQLRSNRQFTVPLLAPYLTKRMSIIHSDFRQSQKMFLHANQLMRVLRSDIASAAGMIAALYSIINATDFDSGIYNDAKDLYGSTQKFLTKSNELFDTIQDEFHQTSSQVDIQAMLSLHLTIDDLIHDETETETWVIEKIDACDKQLHTDLRILSTKSIRKTIASRYVDLEKQVADIYQLNNTIAKRKASNPLISDELIEISLKTVHSFTKVHKDYNRWINAFYVHTNQIEVIAMDIAVYRLLASKITSTEAFEKAH